MSYSHVKFYFHDLNYFIQKKSSPKHMVDFKGDIVLASLTAMVKS